jgi:hypothetical protein
MWSFDASNQRTSVPEESAVMRSSRARVNAADDDNFMSCVDVWIARMRLIPED